MQFFDVLLAMGNKEASARTATLVHRTLTERGVRPFFLTHSVEADIYLKAQGIREFVNVHRLAESIEIPPGELEETVGLCESRFGVANMRELIFPNLVTSSYSEEELLTAACRYFLGVSHYLSETGIRATLFIGNPGGDVPKRVLYHLAPFYVRKPLFIVRSPFPGRSAFYIDEMGTWDGLEHPGPEPTSEVQQAVSGYMRAVRRERAVLGGGAVPISEDVKKHAKRAVPVVLAKLRRRRGGQRRSLPFLVREHVSRYVRWLWMKPRYSNSNLHQKYVYFPLHWWRESSMTIRAYPYFDQAAFIELVARSLPVGHRLYVKEHPRHVGATPLPALRRIVRTPNVRVVPPLTNSHDLIDGASAVVVLSSTVGLEALIRGRPVITLGRRFFARAPLTRHVTDLFNLPEVLAEACRGAGPDEATVHRFLCSAWRATHDGVLGSAITRERPEEVVAAAHAIADKVEEYRREDFTPQADNGRPAVSR